MPGMGHNNKIILSQERPRKKLVTKRRQKRAVSSGEQKLLGLTEGGTGNGKPAAAPTSSDAMNMDNEKALDSRGKTGQSRENLPQTSGNAHDGNSLTYAIDDSSSDQSPLDKSDVSVNVYDSGSSNGSRDSDIPAPITPFDINHVSHTISTMSIISDDDRNDNDRNNSFATLATMATHGSTVDQTMNT